jgi:hypothetical protein
MYKQIFAATAATALVTATAQAAFIIEPNGTASANFVAGTTTSNSTAASNAPGTTGVQSVFGGEPYVYTYTPAVDGDNVFTGATTLNSFAGLESTGLTAGAAGFYDVYHVYPEATNSSGQPTLFDLAVNGVTQDLDSFDQTTAPSLVTGENIGLWRYVGQVAANSATDIITVTITTETSGFVGARSAALLFDYAGPIPEPASIALLAAGGAVAMLRRRTA